LRDNVLGPISIVGFLLFMLLIYCANVQWRRRKYRLIADALGAEFQSQGLFKSGKIAGSTNQRKYTVENQDGARGSGMLTIVEMQCANAGILLRIDGHFFKGFPNWRYASTLGDRTERVFVTNITLQGVGIPLEEKYKTQVQNLFQEFALLDYPFLRRGLIKVEYDRMSFMVHGILNSLDVIRQILSVLSRVAERIETAPIA
jgi:hypothetical protein